ncbi:MAG: aldehyde dehydrogenase family protein [Euzebya sp.]
MAGRVDVRKTYKLYIGGAFPRSESGRTYVVSDHREGFLANAAMASRKDARDAVVAARKAFGGWADRTAYNRGQILYRVAEILEGRRDQLTDEIAAAEGLTTRKAAAEVDAAVDRWVWYAGWTDKLTQVMGGANPVAGPYFNLTSPEPTGIVAVAAPQDSSLLGLVSVMAPAIACGNVVVVVAAQERPIPAITLSEILHTSDVPGGVVNILTGVTAELMPVLAAHMDVNAVDLAGVASEDLVDLEIAAADSTKRIIARPQAEDSWHTAPGLQRLRKSMELKTVWHPIGT